MAIAALVFAFLLPPFGILLSHVAATQIKLSGVRGHGLVIAARVVGYLLIVVGIVAVVLAVYLVYLTAYLTTCVITLLHCPAS